MADSRLSSQQPSVEEFYSDPESDANDGLHDDVPAYPSTTATPAVRMVPGQVPTDRED